MIGDFISLDAECIEDFLEDMTTISLTEDVGDLVIASAMEERLIDRVTWRKAAADRDEEVVHTLLIVGETSNGSGQFHFHSYRRLLCGSCREDT